MTSVKIKVFGEGYCCLHGYLRLCQARGETRKGMAKNIKMSHWAISYNLRALAQGKRPCQVHSDCMIPIIQEVEKLVAGSGVAVVNDVKDCAGCLGNDPKS